MKVEILQTYISDFRSGKNVAPGDADDLFDGLLSADDVGQIVRLLHAWDDKGTSDDELFTFASLMRRRMKSIDARGKTCVDIVGTGGSRVKTFNVSTAAAFVISGAGLPVAKHGNRAATSKSGSFDCLSLLGVNADVEPSVMQMCFDELEICFMFAPRFHALSPTLAEARRTFAKPTIFNNLGPLSNPASAPHQVIGVWRRDLSLQTARALARLDSKRSWVVHGEMGLDEISLVGKTRVVEIKENGIETLTLTAKDFGVEHVAGTLPPNCSPTESMNLIKEILKNNRRGDDAEKLVLINAAAAIYIATSAGDLRRSYSIAEESLRSGAALEKLSKLAEMTKQ